MRFVPPPRLLKGIALVNRPSVQLHGCTHSGSIYEWQTGYSYLANWRGFIVIYPSTLRDNHVRRPPFPVRSHPRPSPV